MKGRKGAGFIIFRKKESGSIMDFLSAGMIVIAMSVLMMAYMNQLQLLNAKLEVGQLARKYILRMETVGFLTAHDKAALTRELEELGITEVDFSASTMSEQAYGSPITLRIQGMIPGREMTVEQGLFSALFRRQGYPFHEIRVSTAKN
ncbi:MAG: hypothetical protein LBQ15_00260 [Clostridium sp.]|jgi:hypothetical protein|nr:hypothetical protein [Clostridium sp.]